MDIQITLDLAVVIACALGLLVAGAICGYHARRRDDANIRTPYGLHTTNSSLVDLHARRALRDVGVRPHARAGSSPLKPSYDGRKPDASAASQSAQSPRG